MSGRRAGLIRWSAVATLLLLASVTRAQDNGLPAGFVALRSIDPSIGQDIRYAGGDNFTGHPLPGYGAAECLLRRPVALALKRVQADLTAQGYSLKIYDCYRPPRAIAAMERWADDPHAMPDTRRFYPGLEKSRLFTLGFIASHSAHSRGVAVDLTLVPRDAPPQPAYNAGVRFGSCAGPAAARAPDNSLDMGTAFDCFNTRSSTHAASISPEQRAHRQLLLQAMARQGFRNYAREWWHFSFPAADTRQDYDFPIRPR